MSAWERTVDEMVREAHSKTRVRSDVEAAAARAAREAGGDLRTMTLRMDKELSAHGVDLKPTFAIREMRGTRFLLDRHLEDDVAFWHLSVSRIGGWTPDAAVFVDMVVERMGAPKEPLFVPNKQSDPIHWRWRDKTDADDVDDAIETLDDVTSQA